MRLWSFAGMCTRPFFYSRPGRDRDQGRGVPSPRQDRAEALLRLETASRPRPQDRGHIPHPHHFEDSWWRSPKKKWGSLELRLNRTGIHVFERNFIYVMLKCQGCAWGFFSRDRGDETETLKPETEAETRPRRLKFQPRRDRAEALLRLESDNLETEASRPRPQSLVICALTSRCRLNMRPPFGSFLAGLVCHLQRFRYCCSEGPLVQCSTLTLC